MWSSHRTKPMRRNVAQSLLYALNLRALSRLYQTWASEASQRKTEAAH